jgi:hypothetical protein
MNMQVYDNSLWKDYLLYEDMYTSQWTGFELTTLVVIWHDHDGPCPYQSPKEKSIVKEDYDLS